MSFMERAKKALRSGDAATALNILEDAVAKKQCQLVECAYMMAYCLMVLRKEPNRAGKLLKLYVKEHAEDFRGWQLLGQLYFESCAWDLAEASLRKAISVSRNDNQCFATYSNLASVLFQKQQYEEAREFYELALKVKKEASPNLLFNYGQSLLLLGRWQEGFLLFEKRTSIPLYNEQNGRYQVVVSRMQEWKGEIFSGKSLLVLQDMGFGDTIHMGRYLSRVKQRGGYVIFAVHPSLQKLFASCPWIDEVINNDEASLKSVRCEFYVLMMSLPLHFGTTISTIPWPGVYVDTPARQENVFLNAFRDAGKHIGLVWASGQPQGAVTPRARSAWLKDFAPLMSLDKITFHSLQVGKEATEEVHGFLKEYPRAPIVNQTHLLKDFADTAAYISRLDAVVTVDTAVAHLAGAMGKPVFVLLPQVPCWRWGTSGEATAWYPSMKLFRALHVEHPWKEPIERVLVALRKFKNEL